jgi:glutathione synthase
MRSLFVMDPLPDVDRAADSTWMLMLESRRRGWPVHWCEPRDLWSMGDRVFARARSFEALDRAPFYRSGVATELPLADCRLVWMRKDPPVDMDYFLCTYLLDLAARSSTVLNAPRALQLANEKIFALHFPELCPETVVCCDPALVRATVERMERAVIKPWDGCGGRGVVLTGVGDPNLGVLADLLTDNGARAAIVQRYLPAIRQGDKRIILVDGEPLGWINRVPGPRDHRGNMHVGAAARPCELDDRDRAICAAIGPALKESGMIFVGIDVIGGLLTEINVTSPTGIQEANRFLGTTLERDIVDAALRRAHLLHGDEA